MTDTVWLDRTNTVIQEFGGKSKADLKHQRPDLNQDYLIEVTPDNAPDGDVTRVYSGCVYDRGRQVFISPLKESE